ncbi:hypothetical protein GUJ93_ZPchr0014g47242 [Zizania palustris]|uniref:Uncharacterized protein n=1 Tax=Zizania palustris TaxID=103762 RepID=A0A8J5TKQ3_ZIZPA|nr:hypothetical protein GUJ93_ZPchr0014g47242 [Zizania palustris]
MTESTLLNHIEVESSSKLRELDRLRAEEFDLLTKLEGLRVKIIEQERVVASFLAQVDALKQWLAGAVRQAQCCRRFFQDILGSNAKDQVVLQGVNAIRSWAIEAIRRELL